MDHYSITILFSIKQLSEACNAEFIFPFHLYIITDTKQAQIDYTFPPPELNPQIVSVFAAKTGLLFDYTGIPQPGNLCFAGNPELRDDYKTTFTVSDILDYTFGMLYTLNSYNIFGLSDQHHQQIPYPQDAAVFHRLVQTGKNFRLLQQ